MKVNLQSKSITHITLADTFKGSRFGFFKSFSVCVCVCVFATYLLYMTRQKRIMTTIRASCLCRYFFARSFKAHHITNGSVKCHHTNDPSSPEQMMKSKEFYQQTYLFCPKFYVSVKTWHELVKRESLTVEYKANLLELVKLKKYMMQDALAFVEVNIVK